jgi:hypothetical protein
MFEKGQCHSLGVKLVWVSERQTSDPLVNRATNPVTAVLLGYSGPTCIRNGIYPAGTLILA